MEMKKPKRFLLTLAGIYWALVVMIYLVAGDQFHHLAVTSDALSGISVIGELTDGQTVTQRLVAPADTLTGLEIMAATYGRSNTGTLQVSLTRAWRFQWPQWSSRRSSSWTRCSRCMEPTFWRRATGT